MRKTIWTELRVYVRCEGQMTCFLVFVWLFIVRDILRAWLTKSVREYWRKWSQSESHDIFNEDSSSISIFVYRKDNRFSGSLLSYSLPLVHSLIHTHTHTHVIKSERKMFISKKKEKKENGMKMCEFEYEWGIKYLWLTLCFNIFQRGNDEHSSLSYQHQQ